MRISKEIVIEALEKIERAESARELLMETFQKICEENPYLGDFIDATQEVWKEAPPKTLDEQLSLLFTDLVVLVNMFQRQEEVDRLEKLFSD